MREIKFRAWIKRKNELMYLKGFRYSGNEKIKITFTDEDCDDCTYTFLKEDVILEQFTGLHDKNGVKIYEGDIVEILDDLGGMGEVELTYKVKWNDELCQFVLNGINNNNYNLSLARFDVEVIGNIHEVNENDK